jgi:hypothetical protein
MLKRKQFIEVKRLLKRDDKNYRGNQTARRKCYKTSTKSQYF